MEISPVTGVRIAPMIRSKVTELGLTDIYETEHTSRSGDETYSPSVARATSGFDEDEDKYEDLEDAETRALLAEQRQINFVA
jgi:hypothetical protein